MKLINESFYLQEDVTLIARQLLGKMIISETAGIRTSGIITETEAYAGESDRASHAYGGRRTPRTEAMYEKGGSAYVYLCYGLHRLFNVVTNRAGVPHAVLIRAIHPIEGIEAIQQRLAAQRFKPGCIGPSKVSAALGITLSHNKASLITGEIRIAETKILINSSSIIVGPRIGVDYAGADAQLPYRFRVWPEMLESILLKH